MNLFDELNNLSSKYRFYPKKGSKTHFIIDSELIQRIISFAELKKSDKVLEVNAGEFFIARKISKKSSLIAFENRKELIFLLEKELSLKVNSLFLSAKKINSNKCISFLSSDNSTEIFVKLLFFDLNLMVLILQKDFSARIFSEPGFADFNALTVLTKTFFEIELKEKINPDSFFPRTSSDFFAVKFKKKKTKIKNKKDFFEFVKALFRFKNRSFNSALIKAVPLMNLDNKTKNKIIFKAKETDFKEKIYLMNPKNFVELFNFLF